MSKQPPPTPTASAVSPCPTVIKIVGRPDTGSLLNDGENINKKNKTISERLIITETKKSDSWLVGCSGFNGPLRQFFSLYRDVSQREGERKDK